MKKLTNLLITFVVVLGLAWTLWTGMRKHQAKSGEEGSASEAGGAPAEEEKAEDFVVSLEKEKWQALDLEKGEPEKAELKPQRIAFGRVLDPTPIVTLDGDLAAAEAAISASRAEYERTQKLFAAGEGASRKAAETAEAQFRADEIKADGLRRRALIEWGALLPAQDPVKRRALVEQLVHGDVALVRVEVLPGDSLAEQPGKARLVILGREDQPVETSSITPAADVDAKTQAQGFILRVDQAPFPLRPGMALTAWLELPQAAREGFAIPRSAVLRHDGRTWVFIQEEEEKFVRKPVLLDTPLDGDKGWFITAKEGGIKADDLLVVTGAQALLSEELKSQGGAAD